MPIALPGRPFTPIQVAWRQLRIHHHGRRENQIPIALAAQPEPNFPRLRALALSIIDFFLSMVMISGIGVVLGLFPLLNRLGKVDEAALRQSDH